MLRGSEVKKEADALVLKIEALQAKVSAENRTDAVVGALLDLARIVQKLSGIQRVGF